jgi:hypothetical protein
MRSLTAGCLTICCLVSFAVHATPVSAQETPVNTLTEQEKTEGWRLLFDGSSLDGWMSWRTKQPLVEGKWKIVDGALTLAEKGGGDIYTAEPFENFEFSVEWKTTGNSGLFIRVDPAAKGAIFSVAPEVQVERSMGTGSTSAGGLYALYEIEGEKVLHPDDWNEYRIKMVDGHGIHYLNGVKLYEYTIGSDDWKARVAKSKFKGKADVFGMKSKGHIGFQDHGNRVAFRNVKIRPMPVK